MEIEPFLVASSLMAVIAQRLLRFLCNSCKEPYEPHDDELIKIGLKRNQLHDGILYRAKGCDKCFNMGYSGRTGIFEMLLINDDIRNLTLSQVDSTKIKRMDGAEKVAKGLTSVDEVMRVTEEESII
jgi:type II secretory ATPase GspE/PulE/Tfp pilus assembly ATPase PilB-like protein